MADLRAWISVAGLTLEDEATWEAFMDALERTAGECGPVLAFDEGGAQVVMSVDAGAHDEAGAASLFVAKVADAIRAVGIDGAYPSGVELALDRGPA